MPWLPSFEGLNTDSDYHDVAVGVDTNGLLYALEYYWYDQDIPLGKTVSLLTILVQDGEVWKQLYNTRLEGSDVDNPLWALRSQILEVEPGEFDFDVLKMEEIL